MASGKMKIDFMSLEGKTLNIFGQRGVVFENGKWGINALGDMTLFECSPAPASPEIEQLLDEDIKDGKGDMINHVLVDPRTALRLYLEGKINRSHVVNATSDRGCVTFLEIEFSTCEGSRRLPVVVEPKATVSTIDRYGNIV